MTDTIEKVEMVEQRLSLVQIQVLATILEEMQGHSIGVRQPEINAKSGLGDKTQECVHQLEYAGLVCSSVLQVGTGGTVDRFFKPCPGVSIKVFGPPKTKHS